MKSSFTRSTSDRFLLGICGRIARMLGVESLFIRIAMVVAVIFLPGPGWLLYPALWLVMPDDQGGAAGYQVIANAIQKNKIDRR